MSVEKKSLRTGMICGFSVWIPSILGSIFCTSSVHGSIFLTGSIRGTSFWTGSIRGSILWACVMCVVCGVCAGVRVSVCVCLYPSVCVLYMSFTRCVGVFVCV